MSTYLDWSDNDLMKKKMKNECYMSIPVNYLCIYFYRVNFNFMLSRQYNNSLI